MVIVPAMLEMNKPASPFKTMSFMAGLYYTAKEEAKAQGCLQALHAMLTFVKPTEPAS